MQQTYCVRVGSADLGFCAAHFITFNGNICERMHGHNYRVTAEWHGPLDENHYVFDFIALRDALRTICAELDHHVLLPTRHPQIRVTADERKVEAVFEQRRWEFPRDDCVLLDVPNTTAELVSQHIGHRLLAALAPLGGAHHPTLLRITLEEGAGLSAVCEIRP